MNKFVCHFNTQYKKHVGTVSDKVFQYVLPSEFFFTKKSRCTPEIPPGFSP